VQDMVKSLDEFEKDSILMHCSMWVVIYCVWRSRCNNLFKSFIFKDPAGYSAV